MIRKILCKTNPQNCDCPMCKKKIKSNEFICYDDTNVDTFYHVNCMVDFLRYGSISDPKNLQAVKDLESLNNFKKIQEHVLNGGNLLDV